MKNWGIPYMGSKSGIISLIQYVLDRHYNKKHFIDMFAGVMFNYVNNKLVAM